MLLFLMLSGFFGACSATDGNGEVFLVDSLNRQAYVWRYKDLERSHQWALQAWRHSGTYSSGRAEATSNLGFAAFMSMDFIEAERCFRQVEQLTGNELERLVADVGLMKICQRKSLNKEFYDYRNRALKHLKRIEEESHLFASSHERQRLYFARSEFFRVSAVYYNQLQQRDDALQCIRQMHRQEGLQTDTAQLLYYHYIKGAAGLCEASSLQERRLQEFDELYGVWRLAVRYGYRYFEGNGLQGIADCLLSSGGYDFLLRHRRDALSQLGLPLDSLLPLKLSQQALLRFSHYSDPYHKAGTYLSIGKYLNLHGRYEEAVDTLSRALDEVNHLKGMAPERFARICEQFSVSYAGLGQKAESDVHRNIYLDMLEDTRQDKELESRYRALERQSRQLNMLMMSVVIGWGGVALLFWLFNRWARQRAKRHLERLELMLEVCRKITSSLPADAQSQEEIVSSMETVIRPYVRRLFDTDDFSLQDGRLQLRRRMSREERAMAGVFHPYIRWTLDNGLASVSLGDERKRQEKQRYVHERHIAGNKRQNVMRKACLALVGGMHPYIDRMLHEARRLRQRGGTSSEGFHPEKYRYMEELADTLNEYYDMLALWIQMKQGVLSMNIETFSLNELFDLLRKGSRSFELKGQTLEVVSTQVVVKADKALTLFMLNTLADNARKYTPQGGHIRVFAQATDRYAEISVTDTGCGLSAVDVSRLNSEKVYDSRTIGQDLADNREEWMRKKGSGFGLMNCKGIVEKYRKTNPVFRECTFGVESVPHQGSRFFFRLPLGVRRAVVLLAVLLSASLGSVSVCTAKPSSLLVSASSLVSGGGSSAPDSVLSDFASLVPDSFEELLDSASFYADEAYYANVDGNYEWALVCIDSAMQCLNRHYDRYAGHPGQVMALPGSTEDRPAELFWWQEGFPSDYHVILDIRNEAAVAFLALKQWDAYSYNNDAYTTLYKLLGEDQSLEGYCRQLERSMGNKRVGMILGILLPIALLSGYYLLYIRKRLQNRWNLEQVFDINSQMFAVAQPAVSEQRMVDAAFSGMRDLLSIDGIGMALYLEEDEKLQTAFHDTGDEADRLIATTLLQRCYRQDSYLEEAGRQVFPLRVEVGGKHGCIGALLVKHHTGTVQDTDRLLLELIAGYISVLAFNAVVKLATQSRDVETAADETRRASWEATQLHVQNQVLDNCLSTIKHETVYYPHKIKQLISKLRLNTLTPADEQDVLLSIEELGGYYKDILTLLSQCASRQLEEVTFRRTAVQVPLLMQGAEKYFRKKAAACMSAVRLTLKPLQVAVWGDANLLQFLLECLVDEALSVPLDGELCLSAEVVGAGRVQVSFIDRRRTCTQEELNRLFYPSRRRLWVDDQDTLHGTEYLLCKQIIRDHEEYLGQRGCGMNAALCSDGGYSVYFSLPLVIKNNNTNEDINGKEP